MYRTFHRWAYRTATIVAVSALTGLTATYSGAASNPTPSSRVAPKSAAVCTPTANPGTLIAARGDSTAIYSHVAGSRSAPTNASQFATSVLGEAVRPPGASVTSISSASNLFVAESTPQIKGLTDVHDAFKVTSPLSTVYHYELTHLPRERTRRSTRTSRPSSS